MQSLFQQTNSTERRPKKQEERTKGEEDSSGKQTKRVGPSIRHQTLPTYKKATNEEE